MVQTTVFKSIFQNSREASPRVINVALKKNGFWFVDEGIRTVVGARKRMRVLDIFF
jgi:hypothetical protein